MEQTEMKKAIISRHGGKIKKNMTVTKNWQFSDKLSYSQYSNQILTIFEKI